MLLYEQMKAPSKILLFFYATVLNVAYWLNVFNDTIGMHLFCSYIFSLGLFLSLYVCIYIKLWIGWEHILTSQEHMYTYVLIAYYDWYVAVLG